MAVKPTSCGEKLGGGGQKTNGNNLPIRVHTKCHETYEMQLLAAIAHFSRLIVNRASAVDSHWA